MTVRVVVPSLGVPILIAHSQHWYALQIMTEHFAG